MPRKKGKSPSLRSLAEFQSIINEQAEQERLNKQKSQETLKRDSKLARDRLRWQSLWGKLNESVVGYQNGKSSRRVVNNLCELNSMVDKLGFGKKL
jgi:hypothetical protein